MTRYLLALVVLAHLSTAAAADNDNKRLSFAVYPKQDIPLAFDHGKHLAQGVDCDTCHDVSKSTKAADLNLPKQADCETCHEIAKAAKGQPTDPPSTCGVCHPGFDPTVQEAPKRWLFPTANINFTHKKHLDLKIDCKTCHGDMTAVDLATRANLPKMETCLKCHDGGQAPNKCSTCHLVQPGGQLQSTFASTDARLVPLAGDPFGLAHTARFAQDHGSRARLDAALCAECHTQADCLQCHDGRTKPLNIHPNDFFTLHPAAARADSPRCDACHRKQSFCISCHEQSGVGLNADPLLKGKNVRVHPDPQVWTVNKGPQHHGVAASRDINACISCHREETCMACHSARPGTSGSFGFRNLNPHPPGFAARCKTIAGKNDRACMKCHEATELAAKGCL